MKRALSAKEDSNRFRYGFQICTNDASERHIGWINAYRISDTYCYTHGEGKLTIGIDIVDEPSRRKGSHAHGKIGCIDTAAVSPSVTWPEKINTLLAKLYREGPTAVEAPLQASLASDNGTLILGYPDAGWNDVYYAVDASGTVLGRLHVDKTSMTSFDAKGGQGSTLPVENGSSNMSWSISFPSSGLFRNCRRRNQQLSVFFGTQRMDQPRTAIQKCSDHCNKETDRPSCIISQDQ
jgi:hypothetical protein